MDDCLVSLQGVPLLYVPLEVVVSKYYGESERLLASIFTAGNELPEGAIIFLDEIDSMAMTRDGEMHEATRRMLSVLLRQMDGFEQDKRIVVIAATNRKQDLDPALLSRFDTSVAFNLPDQSTREEIASQYARHLTSTELKAFGSASEGMSGRDIHDVCQQAERRWASKVTCLTCFSAYVLSSKVSRSLPKSFKSILGLQVGSCFFLLYDVFVFCCSKYFFFSGLKFICIYRIYLSSKIHLD
jgi:hypothetical protein